MLKIVQCCSQRQNLIFPLHRTSGCVIPVNEKTPCDRSRSRHIAKMLRKAWFLKDSCDHGRRRSSKVKRCRLPSLPEIDPLSGRGSITSSGAVYPTAVKHAFSAAIKAAWSNANAVIPTCVFARRIHRQLRGRGVALTGVVAQRQRPRARRCPSQIPVHECNQIDIRQLPNMRVCRSACIRRWRRQL